MFKNIVSISAALLLFFSAQIYADDALISDISKRENVSFDVVKKLMNEGCDSGVTRYMNDCANYKYAGADIQLNRAYQSLLKKFNDDESKVLLIKMQKSWISFRDASCNYESESWRGGTGHHVNFTMCQQVKAEARTEELNAYLKCEDDCPLE